MTNPPQKSDPIVGGDAPTVMHHVGPAATRQAPRDPLTSFFAAATILLGGMIGALVAFPVSAGELGNRLPAWAPFVVFIPLGLAVGYRRRHSRPFFYFTLLSVLILASLLSGALSPGAPLPAQS